MSHKRYKVFAGPRHRIQIKVINLSDVSPRLAENKVSFSVLCLCNRLHKNTSFAGGIFLYHGDNAECAKDTAKKFAYEGEHKAIDQFIDQYIQTEKKQCQYSVP